MSELRGGEGKGGEGKGGEDRGEWKVKGGMESRR